MMATVPHVTSGLGLRKFQADGFLLIREYNDGLDSPKGKETSCSSYSFRLDLGPTQHHRVLYLG